VGAGTRITALDMIIFQQGDQFWIESFEFTPDFISANSVEAKTFTLAKGGQYIGGSCVVDAPNGNAAFLAGVTATMKTTANLHIAIGTELKQFTVQLANDNGGGGTTIGAYVIIFMRRSAR